MARRGRERTRSEAADWLYGIHPVREAIRAGRRSIRRVWIRSGGVREDLQALAAMAEVAGIPVESVPRERLDQQLGPDVQSQGVAAEVGGLPELSLSAMLEAVGPVAEARPVLLALDGVEDPQNVGAIARVADAAGVAGLILTERRAPALTAALARASAGAIEWVPVARVGNLGRALAQLQEAGCWVIAAAAEDGESLFAVDDRVLDGPLVIVVGAEGKGVRPSVASAADHRLWIPMQGGVASLNVSTAGAVLLFEVLRRRAGSTGV